MRGKWMMAAAMAPLLAATSCPRGIYVQVEPRTMEAPPSFALWDYNDDGTPAAFEVKECAAEETMWRITLQAPPDTAPHPLRMAYGDAPDGYHEDAPARPLVPGGCYRAVARPSDPRGEGGSEVFRLLPTGSIIAGVADRPMLDVPAVKELNRASVACVRGYRRARTASDSAAVDARAHVVVDTRLSCGWIHRHWPDALQQTQTRGETLLSFASFVAVLVAITYADRLLR